MKILVLLVLMIITSLAGLSLSYSYAQQPQMIPESPQRAPDAAPDTGASGSKEEDAYINETEENQLTNETDETKAEAFDIHPTGTFWGAPDFSKQDGSLGWSPATFEIPPGFQRRVNFWIDVYTKYSTSQVVLHDAHYIDVIYKVLDLSGIDNDKSLDPFQKARAKKKLVQDEKKRIREQLLRIQTLEDTPSKLSADDLAVYKKFRFVFEKHKFREASSRHRLRMQLGQKDRFLMGLYFSGRYIREMEKIFREEKVPVELTRLPFVESTFNLYAYSKVGASGIWQFMRSTGKIFSLPINSVTDMRNDPLSATRAAARLLRYNYNLLGSWPLALTAYNHGPGGVASIVKKMKTDDINSIVWNTTRRRFGFASENFYAEFLAALEVESHANKYFGKVQVSPPLVYEEVPAPRDLVFGEIAQAMKGDKDDGLERARLFNPFFSRPVMANRLKIQKDFLIRIPKDFKDKFLAQLKIVDGSKITPELKSGLYKILPGDTLTSISRDFGITVKALLEANNLPRRAVLRPGQKIVVPTVGQ